MKYLKYLITTALTMHASLCFARDSRLSKYADILRVIAQVQQYQTLSYSSMDTTYAPITNAPITILQSDGLHLFFCNTSGISIGSSEMHISLVWKNKYGCRHSRSQVAQVILQILTRLIYDKMFSTWNTALTTSITTASNISLTCTSAGICVSFTAPSSDRTNAIASLNSFVTTVKALTVTDAEINTALTSLKTILTSFAGVDPNLNKESLVETLCKGKIDAAVPQGQTLTAAGLAIALGADPLTSGQIIADLENTTTLITHVRAALGLLSTEPAFDLFIASGDAAVKTDLPELTRLFHVTSAPRYISTLSKPFYGRQVDTNTVYHFSRTSSTGNASGGIMLLGPANARTYLAGVLAAYLVKSSSFTGLKYNPSNTVFSVFPMAGQIVLAWVGDSFTGTAREAFDDLVSKLSTRYASGANTADFSATAFKNLVDSARKSCQITTAHEEITGTTTDTLVALDADTTRSAVLWMQLFYGAFGLQNTFISTTTDSQKTTLLTDAAAILTAQATAANCVYYNYST